MVGIVGAASTLHCADRHERVRLDELVFGMVHREHGAWRDAHHLLGDIAHQKMAHHSSPMGSHQDEVDLFRLRIGGDFERRRVAGPHSSHRVAAARGPQR